MEDRRINQIVARTQLNEAGVDVAVTENGKANDRNEIIKELREKFDIVMRILKRTKIANKYEPQSMATDRGYCFAFHLRQQVAARFYYHCLELFATTASATTTGFSDSGADFFEVSGAS